MKLVKFTVVTLLATIALIGCTNEQITFEYQESEKPIGVETGFLSVANLTVDYRVEESSPEFGVEKPKGTTSRAEVNIDDFVCSIINESGVVVKSFKYSERPKENIELVTGLWRAIFSRKIIRRARCLQARLKVISRCRENTLKR